MKKNDLMEECRKRFSSPKIDKLMDLHIEALDKAYDAGYNDAIEKAIEWLESNIDKYTMVLYSIDGDELEERIVLTKSFKEDFIKAMEE